jgi:rare lipoprotein A
MTLRAAIAIALLLAACAQVPPQPEAPAPAPQPGAPSPAVPPAPAAPPPAPTPPPQPAPAQPFTQTGRVSFYAMSFAGKKTASGEIFDPNALTMAHRTLPFGTRVRVTNLENDRSVEVVVNDRGPAVAGRIADLSPAAARAIGLTREGGLTDARIEVVGSTAE